MGWVFFVFKPEIKARCIYKFVNTVICCSSPTPPPPGSGGTRGQPGVPIAGKAPFPQAGGIDWFAPPLPPGGGKPSAVPQAVMAAGAAVRGGGTGKLLVAPARAGAADICCTRLIYFLFGTAV